MIEWLSDWLKDIIIIVLLAAFVDLLLPSSNMQKYAKMILGLLIILTIISPIFGILGDEYAIASLVEQEYQSFSRSSQKIDMNINPDKQYEGQMIYQAERTMVQELNGLAGSDLAVNITDIELRANISEDSWIIERLDIYVAKESNQSNKKSAAVEPIESVQEVNVKLDQHKQTEEMNATAEKTDTENQRIVSEIIKLVKSEWGIAEEIIFVIIE